MLSVIQQPILSLLKMKPSEVINNYSLQPSEEHQEEKQKENEKLLEIPGFEVTLDHYESIFKWIIEEASKNIPITALFINYQKNYCVKIEIDSEKQDKFFILQEDGNFKEFNSFEDEDFTGIIVPWIIISLSIKSLNNAINYTLDSLLFHLDQLLNNVTNLNKELIKFIKDNEPNLNLILERFEEKLFDFDSQLENLFKSANYDEIVEKHELYISTMSSITKVVEAYISLRKYTEVESLIQYSIQKFTRTTDNAIRLFLKGKEFFTQGKTKEAVILLENSIEILDSSQKYWKEKNSTIIGWILIQQGNYQNSLSTFLKILPFFEQVNDQYECNLIYSGLNIDYGVLLDFEKALFYGEKNLAVYKQWNNKRLIAHTINNLGVLNEKFGNFASAITQYKESLQIFIELNNTPSIASCKNNIANIYRLKGDLDIARVYIDEALKIRIQLNNPREIAASLSRLALIDLMQGNLEKSKSNFENSNLLYDKTGEQQINQVVTMNSALILHFYGESKKSVDKILDSIEKFAELKNYDYLLNSIYYLLKVYSSDNDSMPDSLRNLISSKLLTITSQTPSMKLLSRLINAKLKVLDKNYSESEEIANELLSLKDMPFDYIIESYDLLLESIINKLNKELSSKEFKNLEKAIMKMKNYSEKKELKILLCKSELFLGKLEIIRLDFEKGRYYLENALNLSLANKFMIYSIKIEKELLDLQKLQNTVVEIDKNMEIFHNSQLSGFKNLINYFISFS